MLTSLPGTEIPSESLPHASAFKRLLAHFQRLTSIKISQGILRRDACVHQIYLDTLQEAYFAGMAPESSMIELSTPGPSALPIKSGNDLDHKDIDLLVGMYPESGKKCPAATINSPSWEELIATEPQSASSHLPHQSRSYTQSSITNIPALTSFTPIDTSLLKLSQLPCWNDSENTGIALPSTFDRSFGEEPVPEDQESHELANYSLDVHHNPRESVCFKLNRQGSFSASMLHSNSCDDSDITPLGRADPFVGCPSSTNNDFNTTTELDYILGLVDSPGLEYPGMT